MSDDMMLALYSALALAQGEFGTPSKNCVGQVGNGKFVYSDLSELIRVTRPALSKHGLSVVQMLSSDGGREALETVLAHKSGGVLRSTIAIPAWGGDLKKLGANVTYVRRYAYQGILCLAADDDPDSMRKVAESQPSRPQSRQAPPVAAVGEKSAASKPPYSQEAFDKNFPSWVKLVGSKVVTPSSIIEKIEQSSALSEEQKAKIEGIK